MSENPFSPTPLGKDWQPPFERRTNDQQRRNDGRADVDPFPDHEEHSTDLGSLFPTDSTAEQTTAPANQESNHSESLTDLGALFTASLENDRPSPLADELASGSNGGLDTLFGDVVSDDASTSSQTSLPARHIPGALETVTDAFAPARPRARRRALPRTLENALSGDAASATPTNSSSATALLATPETSDVDDVASPPRVEPSERRFPVPAVPESTSTNPGTDANNQSYLALFARGGREVEQLWQIVDRTLGVISGDIALQRLAGALRLLPDREAHRTQQIAFQAALRPRMAQAGITLGSVSSVEPVLDLIVDEVTGISVLGEYYRDPAINEILVDRWDIISVERLGRLEKTTTHFRDPQHAESTARGLALKISDRAVSRSIPLVTAELPSARVTFAFGSVVKGGLSVTIRKFRDLLSLDDLLVYGTLNEEMVDFLRAAVTARASILVSGGTGTGKTTIVNMLSTFIPDSERVITIEDAFELELANSHVVSLQTKEASSLDDVVSVTLAHLLRNTLRMRPDRIIVGEIREGEGAMVMLTAANTGHDGTITTIHANSADAAMNERLPDLVRQERNGMDDGVVLRSISGAFDLVLQVNKSRNGRRYIAEISNVGGLDAQTGRITLEPIFTVVETAQSVTFRRHGVRSDTELGRRLTEGGWASWTK